MMMVLMISMLSATSVIAIELGELQAIPGTYPPYVFRLSIIFSPYGPSDIPTVTVRQPRNVLSLVKNDLLELRLQSLTDVELEIRQGGQTLNRLLLKGELQMARERLEVSTMAVRQQPAIVKDRHDPAIKSRPLTSAATPPDKAPLEPELQEIRQAIQTLVGQVTPWEGLSTPTRPDERRAIAPVFTLLGGCILGLASFCLGYLMRRQAIDHQQRKVLEASIKRLRGQLMSGEIIWKPNQLAQSRGHQPAAVGPLTVKRRVRVSQKTRRRLRVRASRSSYDAIQVGIAGYTQISARLSQPKRLAPAEVVGALGYLRRELINLQRQLPHVSSLDSPHTEMSQTAR
jgi:hypothetical protein